MQQDPWTPELLSQAFLALVGKLRPSNLPDSLQELEEHQWEALALMLQELLWEKSQVSLQ